MFKIWHWLKKLIFVEHPYAGLGYGEELMIHEYAAAWAL